MAPTKTGNGYFLVRVAYPGELKPKPSPVGTTSTSIIGDASLPCL
jgi:hypothetical protein